NGMAPEFDAPDHLSGAEGGKAPSPMATDKTKSPPAKAPPKSDAELLQGEWELMALEQNGQPAAADKIRGRRLTIQGDRFALAKEEWLDNCSFRVDSDKNPKQIDLQNLTPVAGRNPPHLGIYDLRGDTFRLCLSLWGSNPRPAKLGTTPDKGDRLFTFRRVAKRPDQELIQGRWILVRHTRDGQDVPLAKGGASILEIKFRSWDFLGEKWYFVLDESKMPRHIHLMERISRSGPPAWSGIYELRGDKLLVCLPPYELPRHQPPAALAAPRGSRLTLYELERERAG